MLCQQSYVLAEVHCGQSRGDPIPRLEYTPDELRVWGTVLHELRNLYDDGACAEFLRCLPLFDFCEDVVRH